MNFHTSLSATTIKRTKACVLILAITFLSACTSIHEIKNTKVYDPKQVRDGSVNVASRATGIETDKVGKSTFLTFKLGSIKAEGDISASIMNSVNDAITAAGYNSQNGASFNSVDAAYLKAHVESMEFGNFFFGTWGTIILHLRLETREGDILWKTRLRSNVSTISSYERTARVTMNRLVKDMVDIFADEEFYRATQRIKRHNQFLQEGQANSSSTAQ